MAANISAEATRLVSAADLPAMAPLPPLRLEAAPVIPSVPARAARLGSSQTTRAARLQTVKRTPRVEQPEQGFETAFKPDYATLGPYDGSAEASNVGDTVQDAAAMGAEEVRAEALSIDTSMSAGPFPASAPSQDAPATVELPAVQLTAPTEQLPG